MLTYKYTNTYTKEHIKEYTKEYINKYDVEYNDVHNVEYSDRYNAEYDAEYSNGHSSRYRGRNASDRRRHNRLISGMSVIAGLILSMSVLLTGCGKASAVSGTGTATKGEEAVTEEATTKNVHPYDITLTFTGDINLAEGEPTTKELDKNNGDITKCISPELIQYMKAADVTLVNNEFCYSDRGEPLANKMWTFRAKPERAKVLNSLGVDVAQLANNHVYDYGQTAMYDTFDALDAVGIPYVGAGRNLEEAMKPFYTTVDGKKIAIVAASRAEKYKMTPQATDSTPGILRCYDTELFIQTIKEARENADYVVAVVHWGTEHTTMLEEVQRSTARDYIDAGADIIIGGHSHCLQGIEYYEDKPIFYSLGNFWFDEYNVDTMLVNIRISGDDETESKVDVSVVPAVQDGTLSGCVTRICTEESDKNRIFGLLNDVSINADVDKDGVVKQVK